MLDNIFEVLKWIATIPAWAVGVYTFFHWFKTPPEPNDQSNRLNTFTSWHIGLTRPNIVGAAFRRFFKNDVLDNLEDSNKLDELEQAIENDEIEIKAVIRKKKDEEITVVNGHGIIDTKAKEIIIGKRHDKQ